MLSLLLQYLQVSLAPPNYNQELLLKNKMYVTYLDGCPIIKEKGDKIVYELMDTISIIVTLYYTSTSS